MVSSIYLVSGDSKSKDRPRCRPARRLNLDKIHKINTPDGRSTSNQLRGENWQAQSRGAIINALEQFKRVNPGVLPGVADVAKIAMISKATVYRVAGRGDPELHRLIKWRGKAARHDRVEPARQLEIALDLNSELEHRIRLLEGELVIQEEDRKSSHRRIIELEEHVAALLGQSPVPKPFRARAANKAKPKHQSHLTLVADSGRES
jgi:hypothetical protein